MYNLALWKTAADDIAWYQPPTLVLDDSNSPFNRGFPDGITNACYNALDIHVEQGRGDQLAVIYDSPVAATTAQFTYSELLDVVARTAAFFLSRGVEKGDRVVIYVPMIPDALIAMLGCARIGVTHSVVFGGFASNELATRIDDAKPTLIFSASCGIEAARIIDYKTLLDEAIKLAVHKPDTCLIVQRPQLPAALVEGRDFDWNKIVPKAARASCVQVNANHPLYILYTSGATRQPKGVVRDTGGYIVSLKWSMANIYNVKPGDVYWAASDIGWVVGHSCIDYGPLFNGNTTVIYQGKPVGTPNAGAFWRVISDYKVSVLFTAPTAFRAVKKEDPHGDDIKEYDLSSLKALFLAGERCDPDTLNWATEKLQIPVVDHWWQTETSWSIYANFLGMEDPKIVVGSPGKAVPVYDVQVVADKGSASSDGGTGSLVIKLPPPPGTFTTLWQADERYCEAYFNRFPKYYETGDAGYVDKDGNVFVMSHTDDVINVASHRLSTGALEEVLTAHPRVAECAVVGIDNVLKGQIPLGFVVLNSGVNRTQLEIADEIIQAVRDTIGTVAAFKRCLVVNRLPKTRSGKIFRATLRSMAEGKVCKTPATIDDPAIFDKIEKLLFELP